MDPTRQLREEAAVCDFVAQFLADRDRGATRALAEYQACFPEFAERIASEHRALLAGTTTPSAAPLAAGRDVGPYRLIERLGHGGQGVVFRAEHRELQRTVALKMLHQGVFGLSGAHRARLRREAITVARLDHPSICPIYEVELEGPEPYLAMRYVPGRSLAAELEQARQQRGHDGLPPHTRAAIADWLSFFERAALALHAAHQVDIVHRDVKPHNLMRTPEGGPVLLDFGLARDVRSTSAALTRSHELFGTLAYMAPELLAGKAEPSPRHDVYALGVSLYETVTLEQPFAAATPEALWKRIESGSVTAPRTLNRHLPKDLDVVVATALERDPARRYPTALALAEDLRRVRLGERILARPVSRLRRTWTWARRHPVAASGLAAVVGLALIAVLLAVQARRSERSANSTLAAFDETDSIRALEHLVEAARVMRTPRTDGLLWSALDRCHKAYEIERFVPDGTRDGDRLFGAGALDRQGERMAFLTPEGELEVFRVADGARLHGFQAHAAGASFDMGPGMVATSPNGEYLVTGGLDGLVKLWRTDDWSAMANIGLLAPEAATQAITAVAVSSDSLCLAAGGAGGSLLVHHLGEAKATHRLDLGTWRVARASFSPGSNRVLAMLAAEFMEHATRQLSVVDALTGTRLWTRTFTTTGIASFCWHPTGRWLALGTTTAELLILDAETGATVSQLDLPPEEPWIRWCSSDPTGQFLLVGAAPGTAVLRWPGGHVEPVATIRHALGRATTAATFSPDGSLLVTLARDSSMSLVDAQSWSLLCTFDSKPMATGLLGLQWAVGAGRIIAARNMAVDVWYAPPREFVRRLFVHTGAVRCVDVHPDGGAVLSAGEDGRLCYTDLTTGACRRSMLDRPATTARFSPSGRRHLACDGQRVLVFNGQDTEPVLVEAASSARFLDDTHVLLVRDRAAVRLDVATGSMEQIYQHGGAVRSTAVDATNGWLFTAGADRFVRAASGTGTVETTPFEVPSPERFRHGSPWDVVGGLGVAPSSGLLLASCVNDALHVYAYTDAGRRRLPQPLVLHTDRFGGLVAVDPTEKFAVLADSGFGRITWFDLDTLELQPVEEEAHTQTVTAICFTRSGHLCLTASLDGTVRIWDTATRRIRSTLRLGAVPIHDACFMSDDRGFVTGDAHGGIRVWPVEPLTDAERYLEGLQRKRR